jgi:hypothetical protein
MPVIVVRPIGTFRAVFDGVQACKNADYCNVLLSPEYDNTGEFKPEKYLHSSDEIDKLKGLEVGKQYLFRASVGINASSSKDGKTYPARLNLKVLDVRELPA